MDTTDQDDGSAGCLKKPPPKSPAHDANKSYLERLEAAEFDVKASEPA